MNTTLLAFVVLYLVGTMAIGMYAGTRVKNATDFAVAGHSLPLAMVITTTFATWFGAETVMGIPAKFVEGGLNAVIEDPFGASMCLVLVGAFFATRLYRMNLMTIGDFYRDRYGPGSRSSAPSPSSSATSAGWPPRSRRSASFSRCCPAVPLPHRLAW